MSERKKRWTVAVDVDGVIHSYSSGWQGADVIPDPPVPGAIEWLEAIAEEYDIAICSTRAETEEGRQAIGEYLRKHGLSSEALEFAVTIEAGKPPALLYVDDRGWRFTGSNFPSVEQIRHATPWWKRDAK